MSNDEPVSTQLFRRFQPKFRQVTVKPAGFDWPGRSGFSESQLRLDLYQGETRIHFHNRVGLFDLAEAEFSLDVSLSWGHKKYGFTHRVADAIWAKLQQEQLKNLKVYMDPVFEGITDIRFHLLANVSCSTSPTGLHLETEKAAVSDPRERWMAFIPRGPEFDVIQSALALENARYTLAQSEPARSVRTLESELEQKLAVVA